MTPISELDEMTRTVIGQYVTAKGLTAKFETDNGVDFLVVSTPSDAHHMRVSEVPFSGVGDMLPAFATMLNSFTGHVAAAS